MKHILIWRNHLIQIPILWQFKLLYYQAKIISKEEKDNIIIFFGYTDNEKCISSSQTLALFRMFTEWC